MSEDKLKPYICNCCGAVGYARTQKTHCTICKAAIAKTNAWLVGKSGLPPDEELQIMFRAYRKSELALREKSDGAKKLPRYTPTGKNMAGRCLFCGKHTHSIDIYYCANCKRAGFDNVHKVTGKTNGWDKTK